MSDDLKLHIGAKIQITYTGTVTTVGNNRIGVRGYGDKIDRTFRPESPDTGITILDPGYETGTVGIHTAPGIGRPRNGKQTTVMYEEGRGWYSAQGIKLASVTTDAVRVVMLPDGTPVEQPEPTPEPEPVNNVPSCYIAALGDVALWHAPDRRVYTLFYGHRPNSNIYDHGWLDSTGKQRHPDISSQGFTLVMTGNKLVEGVGL